MLLNMMRMSSDQNLDFEGNFVKDNQSFIHLYNTLKTDPLSIFKQIWICQLLVKDIGFV